MRIYDTEKSAGLTDCLCNKDGFGVAHIISPIKPVKDFSYSSTDIFSNMRLDAINTLKSILAQSNINTLEDLIGKDQPDLAIVVSILASAGWNLNDDIFTPSELWKARETAIHKPMNHMHDGNIVLGHIVKSCAVDKNGNEIVLGENDVIPNDFDIEVAGVLYKALPERAELIEEILTKSNNGEMFVSMECWFPDFAYGFIDNTTGATKIVERNEDTAFLTKHLKIYNGTGEFEGRKIGRVLKDIIFGAQGFVTEPANPESVIRVAAEKVAASISFENRDLDDVLKGGVDSMDKEMKDLQEVLVKTNEEKDVLSKKIEAIEAEDFPTKIGALSATVEELTTNLTKSDEQIKTVQNDKVDLQKKLDDAVKAAEVATSDLDNVNKSIKAKERMAKLSEVSVIEDESSTLAELAEMSDSTFEMIMKYGPKKVKDDKTEVNKTEANENKEDDGNTAIASLDDVKIDKNESDFQVGNDNADSNREEVAMALAHTLTRNKHKNDEGGE